jgi:hypothetical protein
MASRRLSTSAGHARGMHPGLSKAPGLGGGVLYYLTALPTPWLSSHTCPLPHPLQPPTP